MDFDFGGSGPNLFSVHDGHGRPRDVLGVGEKSGVYWALDPEDGSLIWHTQVGPGSTLGGIEWGTATDGQRIYVPNANRFGITYTLQPSGIQANSGSWSALDPVDGKLLWQTGTPGQCSAQTSGVVQGCMALGPTSVANGVVFAGSMDVNPNNPTMFALDGSTGKILWSFAAGSSVIAGPAIVADSLYWGAGYGHTGPTIGTPNNKLFAFSVGHANNQ
jgi:polyvinyl alcohol dehydrogenase (cytochrome)